MEDLAESYVVGDTGFIPRVLTPLLDDIHQSDAYEYTKNLRTNPDISNYLRSIQCYQHICVFERNEKDAKEL